MKNSTHNFKDIKAPAEQVYDAIMDPRALEQWMAPGNMRGKIHYFDGVVGGGYEMSLFYPAADHDAPGKTAADEDRFKVQFIELIPGRKITEMVSFVSNHPGYQGEMTIEITLDKRNGSTRVHFLFKNIPGGIRPQDNEAGTISSLNKLAAFVESKLSGQYL